MFFISEESTISFSLSMDRPCQTVPPKVASGFIPGNTSSTGEPLPLLAKILIPVAGVLLIVVVMVTWFCCVQRKETRDCDDFVIESTLMVRLDVTEDPGLSS
ncbi:uncharacterized protein LOC144665068 [Oculina patagonica]